MKKLITKTIVLFLITTFFTSCNIHMFDRVNGNKKVVTKNRKATNNFTSIKVSTGLDLYITQGSKNTITVEADENLHDIIITEVTDGLLKIYAEKNIWRAGATKVFVTIETLEALSATSGSDVTTEETIKVKDLTIIATSGADIRISVNGENIETNSTSGSDITISGTATLHTSKATSGSSIDAYELISKNAVAKVTSGANIDIYASDHIDAKATSGGDIDFKGNPKSITKKTTSGGSVSAR
jgi:hypothetical protein